MMKKNIQTPLTDEYLQSIEGIGSVETDEWFYTRLRARMQRAPEQEGWSFRLKPVWVIGVLAALLILNGWMISEQRATVSPDGVSSTPVQDFAQEYNLSIQSNY